MAKTETNKTKTDMNLKEMRSTVSAWPADMKDDGKETMSCQVRRRGVWTERNKIQCK
jgi:hypothetical protein